MRICDNLYFILVLFELTSVFSVPHEFCLEPFNDNDCDKPPTHVFYYYKPGSRCEISVWRGCPTLNKFPDEYLCSHYCIGSMTGRIDEPDNRAIDSMYNETAAKAVWIQELQQLDVKEIKLINKILEDVSSNVTHQKLSYVHHNKIIIEVASTDLPIEAAEPVSEASSASSVVDNGTSAQPEGTTEDGSEEGTVDEVITT